MRLYGEYRAKNAAETPMIDYIEFEFPSVPEKFLPEDLDNRDLILSCDWDESDWFYDPKTGEGAFRCKGVYLNQVYANGHADLFADADIRGYQVHGVRSKSDFALTKLEVEDAAEKVLFLEEGLCGAEKFLEN